MKKFMWLLLSPLMVVMNQAILSKPYSEQTVFKDPGVVNEERILYWMAKRGELAKNATETEKQLALKQYLKGSEKGAYKFPRQLAKKESELKKRLTQKRKSKVTIQKVQAVNNQNKTVNALVVLVDFNDLEHDNNQLGPGDTSMYYSNYDVAHYRDLIFDTNVNNEIENDGFEGPSGQTFTSAYQFYQLTSGNTFTMQGRVLDWVRASKDAAEYGANDPENDDNDIDVDSLVKEAVDAAVAANTINLSEFDVEDQYDLDSDGDIDEADGIIDHVMVFHSSIGEEAGGGVLGDDAIWSHRGFVDPDTLGYTLPSNTNFKILGYTIMPIDAATGVIVHEFGHDIGVGNVPDEYNTNGPVTSPVVHWSVMASGSWAGNIPGTQPVGFSPRVSDFFQQRYGGNWITPQVFTLEQLTNNPQLSSVVESTNHGNDTNLIKIELPVPNFEPFTGAFQYYSGEGDLLQNRMSFDLNIPASGNVQLQMKAHWNIELDWDYARVLINTGGDDVVLAGNHTVATENQYHTGITDYITDKSADIAGATGVEGWVDLIFDLNAYLGQNVSITIEYITDEFVGGYGLAIDDINLMVDSASIFFDGAENATGANLNGFSRSNGVPGKEQNYWVQMRAYKGVDIGLQSEGYQHGMLVWFDDANYSDNHVDIHPGYGFTGVVDAGQENFQINDATFGLNYSAERTEFNDGNDYSTPQIPSLGKILPNHGLTISIQSQETDSSRAELFFSVGDVAWNSSFSFNRNFRTVSFSNASIGTGNATAFWDFGDPESANNSSSDWEPTHEFTGSGEYTVTLTIRDADGVEIQSSQTITIADAISASFQATDDNGTVTFDATATMGGENLNYSWNFGDSSTTGSGSTTSHTYASSGSYSVTLTVTSTDNQTVNMEQTIDVYILPVASFTFSTSNLSANFTNASTGGSGNITYSWDFGDGSSSTAESPSHTYSSSGTYTVQLTITDGQSNTSSSSLSVSVTSPPAPNPPSSGGGGGGGGSTGLLLLGLLTIGRLLKRN